MSLVGVWQNMKLPTSLLLSIKQRLFNAIESPNFLFAGRSISATVWKIRQFLILQPLNFIYRDRISVR